ncbi:unnamed protein product [Brassica oleracea]
MEDLYKIHGRLMGDFDLGGMYLIHKKTFSGRLLEYLWKTPGRLIEDFDLGGKPKLFQNLSGNHKFY